MGSDRRCREEIAPSDRATSAASRQGQVATIPQLQDVHSWSSLVSCSSTALLRDEHVVEIGRAAHRAEVAKLRRLQADVDDASRAALTEANGVGAALLVDAFDVVGVPRRFGGEEVASVGRTINIGLTETDSRLLHRSDAAEQRTSAVPSPQSKQPHESASAAHDGALRLHRGISADLDASDHGMFSHEVFGVAKGLS